MDPFMRMKIGLLAILSVGALSQALAMEPPTASDQTNTSSSTTAAPAASSTAPSTAPAAKSTITASNASSGSKQVNVVAGDAQAEARLKRLRAAGYRPEMHDKQLLFCRKEQALGSRFDKKVCSTAEALDEQFANGQNLLGNSQRQGLANDKMPGR